MTMDLADSLASRVRGQVITAADAGYDEARATFNGMIDRRPRFIVRPVDAGDIADAVRWAGEVDLPIGVRGGGHSVAGHSMPDDALRHRPVRLARRARRPRPRGRRRRSAGAC